jgi:phage gp46-like protein
LCGDTGSCDTIQTAVVILVIMSLCQVATRSYDGDNTMAGSNDTICEAKQEPRPFVLS